MRRILETGRRDAIVRRRIRIKEEGLYDLTCLLAETIVVRATARALLCSYILLLIETHKLRANRAYNYYKVVEAEWLYMVILLREGKLIRSIWTIYTRADDSAH